MNSLYGDNIFESTDIIMNRLLESIDNDIALFESFNILNEDENIFVKAFNKIKEVITYIKEKIKEIFNKVKSKFFVKNAQRKIQTANAKAKEGESAKESFKPYKVYVLGAKYDKYTSVQLKSMDKLGSMNIFKEEISKEELETIRRICEDDEKAVNSIYVNGKLDIFDTREIKSEEEGKKFLANYESDMIAKICKSMGITEKDLNEIGKSMSNLKIDDIFKSDGINIDDYYNKDTVPNKDVLSLILKTCKTELKFYKDAEIEFHKVLSNPIVTETA